MRKKRLRALILLTLILFISIGFAVLSTNLSINGLFNFTNNTWSIALKNVVVDDTSVTKTAPTINNDEDTITFSAELNKPGDYYSFNVDVENNSSLDAMLGSITTTGITSQYSDYLDCIITYSNGTTPNPNDILYKTARVTFNIKLLYKDITTNQIPENTLSPTVTVTINYRQANNNAVFVADTNHWDYNFTGSTQTFTTPYSGLYKLETWGAQGYVNEIYNGAYGAYSTGLTNLVKNNNIFITVGEKGKQVSTVGKTTAYPNSYAYTETRHLNYIDQGSMNALATGGGSTHIATQQELLKNLEDYKGNLVDDSYYVSDVIIIVSGGGGGAGQFEDQWGGYGGNAGGIEGCIGVKLTGVYYSGRGGTQTSGGTGGNTADTSSYVGLFGMVE